MDNLLTKEVIGANAPFLRGALPVRFHDFFDKLVKMAQSQERPLCLKYGFINVYRSGVFHTPGKPAAYDRHAGDIYLTAAEAQAHIDPVSHYIGTVPVRWVDTEDCQPNPGDRT